MAEETGALTVVLPEAGGGSGGDEPGELGGSLELEGGVGPGDDDDGGVGVDVDGQGLVVAVPTPGVGEETHGDGEFDDEGAVGVVTLTDGEGRTGGLAGWSLWPVSPRCREIHWSWSGS